MTRMKLAELTSGVGALALGVGLGSLFHDWFASGTTVILLLGAAAHAFGMWDKHRLESRGPTARGFWVAAVYWICWIALAALLGFLVLSP